MRSRDVVVLLERFGGTLPGDNPLPDRIDSQSWEVTVALANHPDATLHSVQRMYELPSRERVRLIVRRTREAIEAGDQ